MCNKQQTVILKKLDVLVIVLVVLGIILSFLLVHRTAGKLLLVVYAGEQKKIYSLEDAAFVVSSPWGSVNVLVKDRHVRILQSTCPDQWCVSMGWISKPGQSLVCLPAHIFLTIEEEKREKPVEFDSITR